MGNDLTILIVEDDFVIGADLQMRLEELGYTICGPFASAKETLDALKETPIDFAIFDIEIDGDIDGIDLAEIVKDRYDVPFIFLTNVDDRRMKERAKQVKPYAYMPKPYNDTGLEMSIELALQNFTEKKTAEQEETADQDKALKPIGDTLFIKKNKRFVKIHIDDICRLEADGNYTFVHGKKENYVYTTVMHRLLERLPPEKFVRINRSIAINTDLVTAFAGNSVTINGQDYTVTSSYRKEVFERFDAL